MVLEEKLTEKQKKYILGQIEFELSYEEAMTEGYPYPSLEPVTTELSLMAIVSTSGFLKRYSDYLSTADSNKPSEKINILVYDYSGLGDIFSSDSQTIFGPGNPSACMSDLKEYTAATAVTLPKIEGIFEEDDSLVRPVFLFKTKKSFAFLTTMDSNKFIKWYKENHHHEHPFPVVFKYGGKHLPKDLAVLGINLQEFCYNPLREGMVFFEHYLNSKHVCKENGRIRTKREIAKELQEVALLKTLNHQKLDEILGFGEAKNLDEIVECGFINSDPYLAVCKLGSGRSGTVYKVYSKELKQHRAIKLINPKLVNPDEAQLMARLIRKDLKNIVQIYDAGYSLVTKGDIRQYSILMEYVDGETLKEVIQQGPYPPEAVLYLISQLFEGICSLKEKNITHRDIKPRNAKINSRGIVKILDFGIAVDNPYPVPRNVKAYSPPNNIDVNLDLFSWGLIAYELATGKHLVFPKTEYMSTETHKDEVNEVKKIMHDEEGKLRTEFKEKIPIYLRVPLLLALQDQKNFPSLNIFQGVGKFLSIYQSYHRFSLNEIIDFGQKDILRNYLRLLDKFYPHRSEPTCPSNLDEFINDVLNPL